MVVVHGGIVRTVATYLVPALDKKKGLEPSPCCLYWQSYSGAMGLHWCCLCSAHNATSSPFEYMFELYNMACEHD